MATDNNMPKPGECVVSINGVDYILRRSIKNQIYFEAMSKGNVEITTTFGVVLMFFATIMANNRDCQLTLEEFMDALDEDPDLMVVWSEWLQKGLEQDKVFEDPKAKPEKKSRRKA